MSDLKLLYAREVKGGVIYRFSRLVICRTSHDRFLYGSDKEAVRVFGPFYILNTLKEGK